MFALSIETDNAAFHPDDAQAERACEYELARILRALADRLERGDALNGPRTVQDGNGNTVGAYRLSGMRREPRHAPPKWHGDRMG